MKDFSVLSVFRMNVQEPLKDFPLKCRIYFEGHSRLPFEPIDPHHPEGDIFVS
jgi:hypothetical protein